MNLTELIELGDMDELLRHIDRVCDAAQWDELLLLRDLCRKALERGKQLWPVAANAEYRLALDAPAEWAGQVLVPGTGRFALGPLPEVAASTHRWEELALHAPPGPVIAMAAHERVLRGDNLAAFKLDPPVLELPLFVDEWEPDYPLAQYHRDKADFPAPPLPPADAYSVRTAEPGRAVSRPEAERALLDLAATWTTESNGRAEVVVVEGDAAAAVAALGPPRFRLAPIYQADVMAHMAWTAASGGAYGRRKGMAAGRFGAWWTVVALADLIDEWPLLSWEVGEHLHTFRWYLWDAGEPVTGWSLRLAIEDTNRRLSYALSAGDAA